MNTQSSNRSLNQTLSEGISIQVTPELDPQYSNPEASIYVYRYTVTITNQRPDSVQLMSRQWVISDGFNRVEQVKGPGVVGQTPMLKPGESFSYSSFCPLMTPTGSMKGSFHFVSSEHQEFDAQINEFFLKDAELIN